SLHTGYVLNYDLIVITLQTHNTQVVANDIQIGWGSEISWSPDSKLLAYTMVDGECYIVSTNGLKAHKVTEKSHPPFDASLRGPFWSVTSQDLYFPVANTLWKVSISDGAIAAIATIPDRRLIGAVTSNGGARLWSPDSGRSIYLITSDDATKQSGF